MKLHAWILGLPAIVLALVAGCGGDDGAAVAVDAGTATIGAAGGTVETKSGLAKAVFPANAVSADTTVTITATDQALANVRLVDGTTYEFGPPGPLAQPVLVTLGYDPAKLPIGALESQLVIYKTVNGTWTAMPNSVVDSTARTVTAPLSSFSIYAVLANNQFAGNYAGTYSGDSAGTWSMTVMVDGSLSATATGGFVGTGSVSFTGASTIPLNGSGTSQGASVAFGGTFSQVNGGVSASGTWNSSDGESGNWSGSKLN
ncbi:MAG: hypothetical protein ABIR94_05670 [Rubrivivax sp.]